MQRPRKRFRVASVILDVKNMSKKIYLQTLKIVLGRSILHYLLGVRNVGFFGKFCVRT